MTRTRLFSMFAVALMLAFSALTVMPEEADARRFGGGSSFGSRGSRSFSTPRNATSRTPMQRQQAGQQGQKGSGMKGALMGGLGGLLLGGMLGSMLGGGMGGGFGILEILLLAGAGFMLFRFLKKRKAMGTGTAQTAGGHAFERQTIEEHPHGQQPMGGGGSTEGGFNSGSGDEVTEGLEQIAKFDANFDEAQFVEGAKIAFKELQGAWADWSVERLQPLLTERMWEMIQAHAEESKNAGERNIIEKVEFQTAEISEAWQESGNNFITVHFQVRMIDTTTDLEGNIKEGDPDNAVEVEEYWTFVREVIARDPNWKLTAIQQSGEVARGAR
ncbi:MAG: Tim44 domain-containing protein [Magnetococcales bacterium]|nr:Tim44 domain-containing protein [Magnetococcales bacterium]